MKKKTVKSPLKRMNAGLEERIERIVARAKEREGRVDDLDLDGTNVFRVRLPLRRRLRMKSSKLG